MPNDPIIIGIAVLAIAILGYTAINSLLNKGRADKPDKDA